MINALKILSQDEVRAVIADLRRKRRYASNRLNLIVFRLATCCGLRVSEIVGLNMGDVKIDSDRPHIQVRAAIAKRHRARTVPLNLDGDTLADLTAWKARRTQARALATDAFVCSTQAADSGRRLSIRRGQRKFKQAIKVLGKERVAGVSVHSGRHTFCSRMLDAGKSLAQVRDWAGHASVQTTNLYLHAYDDEHLVGNAFA
jgi:integrase/recombinase XerD